MFTAVNEQHARISKRANGGGGHGVFVIKRPRKTYAWLGLIGDDAPLTGDTLARLGLSPDFTTDGWSTDRGAMRVSASGDAVERIGWAYYQRRMLDVIRTHWPRCTFKPCTVPSMPTASAVVALHDGWVVGCLMSFQCPIRPVE